MSRKTRRRCTTYSVRHFVCGRDVTLLGAIALLVAGCGSAPLVAKETTSTVATTTSTPPTTTTSEATSTSTSQPQSLPAGKPLQGKVVGIDPGHNGLNYTDPSFLAQQVFNGREMEDCDTTGTETDAGYTEAQFSFNVATYLAADIEQEGGQVAMTRTTNSGVGPCITQRAQMINSASSNVAVDIHADGGPATGRGFAILEPVSDGPNDSVIASSAEFGSDLRAEMLAITQMPVSTYDGSNGIALRDDLAGLNLTTVPKVLIECGNMRNSADAALLVSDSFQRQVALAMAIAITNFLA